jgi:septal ring factor EnvC (AmiA/AmiB activator)
MRRLLAAFLLALFQASSLYAQPPDAVKSERELAAVQKALKDMEADQRRLKNEADTRSKEVAALRKRMIETANSLQAAEQRLSEINSDLKKLTTEEHELTSSLRGQQNSLADILAALQSLEMSRPPALLVSPGDANRAARAAMLLANAAPVLERRARELRFKLERLTAVRAARDQERLAHQLTSDEITVRRNVLSELLEKKQTERNVATTLAAAAQRETAALAARASDLREMISRLEHLARVITPRVKPPRPAPGVPVAERPQATQKGAPFKPLRAFAEARGKLKAPVVGRIVNGFGAPKPDGGFFEGLRFLAAPSAIVTAPYEGNVVFARNFGPVGNLIMLDVGGGFHLALAGVGAFLAQEGQTVAAGEPIAAMTASAGTVLEFEIRKNGEPVNPALWLSQPTLEDASF